MKGYLKKVLGFSFVALAVVLFMPNAKAATLTFKVESTDATGSETYATIRTGEIHPNVVNGQSYNVSFDVKTNYEFGKETAITCGIGDDKKNWEVPTESWNYDRATNTLTLKNFQGLTTNPVDADYVCYIPFIPCKTPATGDVSVYLIAGIAIIGLGAFVLTAKKKRYN